MWLSIGSLPPTISGIPVSAGVWPSGSRLLSVAHSVFGLPQVEPDAIFVDPNTQPYLPLSEKMEMRLKHQPSRAEYPKTLGEQRRLKEEERQRQRQQRPQTSYYKELPAPCFYARHGSFGAASWADHPAALRLRWPVLAERLKLIDNPWMKLLALLNGRAHQLISRIEPLETAELEQYQEWLSKVELRLEELGKLEGSSEELNEWDYVLCKLLRNLASNGVADKKAKEVLEKNLRTIRRYIKHIEALEYWDTPGRRLMADKLGLLGRLKTYHTPGV